MYVVVVGDERMAKDVTSCYVPNKILIVFVVANFSYEHYHKRSETYKRLSSPTYQVMELG